MDLSRSMRWLAAPCFDVIVTRARLPSNPFQASPTLRGGQTAPQRASGPSSACSIRWGLGLRAGVDGAPSESKGATGGCVACRRNDGTAGRSPLPLGFPLLWLKQPGTRGGCGTQGSKEPAAASCPATLGILRGTEGFMEGSCFGNAFFSELCPGTHISPHCGPTNARFRVHVALRIPPGCWITVGGERRAWRQGEAIVLDDSFVHEVTHEGEEVCAPSVLPHQYPW